MQEFYSDSAEITEEFAKKLASRLDQGSFLAVYGDLGAGKTVFVKGLAKGLGVKEEIVSPTFMILRVYESGRLPLYHFDVYRIGDESELLEIGFDEYAAGDGVCVCEWAELAQGMLPCKRLDITLERVSDTQRKISIKEVTA